MLYKITFEIRLISLKLLLLLLLFNCSNKQTKETNYNLKKNEAGGFFSRLFHHHRHHNPSPDDINNYLNNITEVNLRKDNQNEQLNILNVLDSDEGYLEGDIKSAENSHNHTELRKLRKINRRLKEKRNMVEKKLYHDFEKENRDIKNDYGEYRLHYNKDKINEEKNKYQNLINQMNSEKSKFTHEMQNELSELVTSIELEIKEIERYHLGRHIHRIAKRIERKEDRHSNSYEDFNAEYEQYYNKKQELDKEWGHTNFKRLRVHEKNQFRNDYESLENEVNSLLNELRSHRDLHSLKVKVEDLKKEIQDEINRL